MMLWVLKKVGWKFALAGAAAALVGERVARPLAVKTVKGSLAARASASRIIGEAKHEIGKIASEARADVAEVEDAGAEIERLRQEIAELKAHVGAPST
jgi:hypothetical protein